MEQLNLFDPLDTDTSLHSTEWIEYRPINQISDTSALEFNIPAQSSAYVDLKRSVLNIKMRLVKADGTLVDSTQVLAPVNVPLHALFSQIDVAFQQTPFSHWGINYPYKAYMDTLLKTNKALQDHILTSQLFYKDTDDVDTTDAKSGRNDGLKTRYAKTLGGKTVELEGPLLLDVFQQPKLLMNGVHLGIKLYQSRNAFRIMSDSTSPDEKVQIVDARFKLCVQRLDNNVLLSHQKLIQNQPATYPYLRSDIKTMSVATGQFSYSADDLFQGSVPCKLIVGLVASEAYSGDYKKNPFNFQHYNCSSVGFYVDGQSYPSRPLQPNFEANQFVDCYRTLAQFRDDVNISLDEYKEGYCLYVLDIDPYYSFNTKRRGHCRLELKFAKALPGSVTVIVYATFPEVLSIDESRTVVVR
ncbi:MAG: hypothetical protein ABW072_02035 [Sedimenticola sp.]